MYLNGEIQMTDVFLVRIFKFVQPYDGGVCKRATIYTTNDLEYCQAPSSLVLSLSLSWGKIILNGPES